MMRIRAALLVGAAILMPQAALAQQAQQSGGESQPQTDAHGDADDFHGVIYVTAGGLERLDLLAGTSVVEGEELQRNMDGQIGEVLAKVPGVSATSFSPGASRPVLRGFQGDRVRVLVDGIGSIDASNTSADHAVTIDPLTAQRIEVLRGPAVLLYGSSAIGGAVNVIDKRIPLQVPDESIHVDAVGAIDTAYDLREGGLSVDVPLSGEVALHLDGSWRKTNDVEIPGYAASSELRADLLADAEEEAAEGHADEAEELEELANISGVLPGSATETKSVGAGFAWFGSGGSLGASVGYYDSLYGVPLRPGAAHHHEEVTALAGATASLGPVGAAADDDDHGEEAVTIGLKQLRADLRATADLNGFFEEARLRVGYSDYEHTEFEGDEVGTVFLVEGVEGRFELIQRERDGWRGSVGAQYLFRDFEAIGAEAFVQPNRTSQLALFTLQETDIGSIHAEFGGRYERTDVNSDTLGISRGFDSFSAALGLAYSPAGGLRTGINLSRASRAPAAEELFAGGPHIATQQYEEGDPFLRQEKATGAEAYLRGSMGGADFGLSLYHTWFDDFIYLAATGEEEDDLPVFEYRQQGAKHYGIEAEASFPLFRGDLGGQGFTVIGDVQGDYVRATLDDGTAVPRIPPLSLLGALELQSDRFDLRGEVQWFDAQDRLAPLETATDGFTQVNLSLAWKVLRGSDNATVILQANNIFDAEGRRHASFTKDFVPLAGRNVKLSLRTSF